MSSNQFQPLREATRQLLEADEDNWPAIEAIWRTLADQGNSEAQFELASTYLLCGFDEGEEKTREMRSLLESAAAAGNAAALYWSAILHQPEGPERYSRIQRAAELGIADAQHQLAARLASGEWPGGKDEASAVSWYLAAALQGHADAQYNLGFMLVLGEGAPADVAGGLQWLRLAAQQGSTDAMGLLSDLLRNGQHGVSVDLREAAEWEERSAAALRGRTE